MSDASQSVDAEQDLLLDQQGGVALVTLNRPSRLNAFTDAMGGRFDELMVRLALDETVKVIVLTGAGRGFCAGSDMQSLGETRDQQRSTEPRPDAPRPAYDALSDAPPEVRSRFILPLAIPKPVIAAVNGACAGVGLCLATACDIRFAADTAQFTAVFARRGLTAEVSLAATLTALIGHGAASDMLFSARKVPAEEALRMGLAQAVLPADALMAHTLAYARDIAENISPRSTRVIKRQLFAARTQTFAETALMSYREAGRSLKSEDFREGIAHFVERRAPRFTGR
jgi:enoyl-CoA hydratase/carnithine racemase